VNILETNEQGTWVRIQWDMGSGLGLGIGWVPFDVVREPNREPD
jgi:hypothetical protein